MYVRTYVHLRVDVHVFACDYSRVRSSSPPHRSAYVWHLPSETMIEEITLPAPVSTTGALQPLLPYSSTKQPEGGELCMLGDDGIIRIISVPLGHVSGEPNNLNSTHHRPRHLSCTDTASCHGFPSLTDVFPQLRLALRATPSPFTTTASSLRRQTPPSPSSTFSRFATTAPPTLTALSRRLALHRAIMLLRGRLGTSRSARFRVRARRP